MKTSLIATAVIAATLFAGNAAAATITFNGKVTDRTCSITGGPGTSGGTGGNFTVTLPSVQAASVTAAGTGDTGFAINITGTGGTGSCPDGTTAKLFWNVFQPNIDLASNSLKNLASGAGAATGTGIGLYNAAGTRIVLSNAADASNTGTQLNSGTAQLRYSAKYVAIGGAVGPGTVQSALEYIVEFN